MNKRKSTKREMGEHLVKMTNGVARMTNEHKKNVHPY